MRIRANEPAVPSLARGFSIVELLARSKGGMTLSQLARSLKLPKSSVYCLLGTLEYLNYISRGSNSTRYRVSSRVYTVAQMALGGTSLRELAVPHLQRLANSRGLTVHMAGVMDDHSIVLIEKISSVKSSYVATWVGEHVRLNCTALGKAIGAYLPQDDLDIMIARQGLIRHNDNTIASPKRLCQELALVRQRGFSFDDEEEEINNRCIGAPIFDCMNRVIAALSVSGTTAQIDISMVDALAREVMMTANTISAQLKESFPVTGAFTPIAELE
jgi:DNA-binding IclR family transcriptional regulator